jgi:hypothetical protein
MPFCQEGIAVNIGKNGFVAVEIRAPWESSSGLQYSVTLGSGPRECRRSRPHCAPLNAQLPPALAKIVRLTSIRQRSTAFCNG